MKILKKGTRVRIVTDQTDIGDIPRSLLHRNGTVLCREPKEDQHGGCCSQAKFKAYLVKMDIRIKPITLFEDEMKVIK